MVYYVLTVDTGELRYHVVKQGASLVLDKFADQKDADEMAEYLNGGDEVPSYMKEEG